MEKEIEKNDFFEALTKQYALDQKKLAIIEAFINLDSNKRKAILDFVDEVYKIVHSELLSEKDKQAWINSEVEAYRKELEIEAKGAVKLSVLEEERKRIDK